MARPKKEKKNQARNIIDILNNSSDRAKLQNFIDEAVRCKIKIADENESIKVLREEAMDKIGVNPKDFNNMLKLFYNNNFSEVQEQIQTLESIIEFITGQSSNEE